MPKNDGWWIEPFDNQPWKYNQTKNKYNLDIVSTDNFNKRWCIHFLYRLSCTIKTITFPYWRFRSSFLKIVSLIFLTNILSLGMFLISVFSLPTFLYAVWLPFFDILLLNNFLFCICCQTLFILCEKMSKQEAGNYITVLHKRLAAMSVFLASDTHFHAFNLLHTAIFRLKTSRTQEFFFVLSHW